MILNEMADRMDASVHGSAKFIFITKILTPRTFLISGNVNCMLYQLIHTLIFCRRNRYYRNSQHGFNPVYINGASVSCDLIHHI